MSNKNTTALFIFLFIHSIVLYSQEIPAVYSNIFVGENTMYMLHPESGDRQNAYSTGEGLHLENLIQAPGKGAKGLDFDFGDTSFHGLLYYGFIVTENVKHPQPVWYKKAEKVLHGKASVNISELKGKYDIINWGGKKAGILAYRLADNKGRLIYDGRIVFSGTGPFEPALTIYEGPFVNKPTPESVTISFRTNQLCSPVITVNGIEYQEKQIMMNPLGSRSHDVLINKLKPAEKYTYEIKVGDQRVKGSFTTPPAPGSRKAFSFGYASDSREGKGGGERSIGGVNMYIMKKIAALASYQQLAFWQFTGDMITGYSTSTDETRLQYANWKRAVEPFWHHIPVITGMGNHESVMTAFGNSRSGAAVDKFPFETSSSEKIYADEFCNPVNGPDSEDGAYYDPNPSVVNFPSYNENVFYYTYDNVAMVVLNSNYWYAPTEEKIPFTGGNPHGYVMDVQLQWLRKTLEMLEADNTIDHVFITLHTPMFPNGGHADDDMWYHGNNDIRPYVAGKPLAKGIIERRDELLDMIVNQSNKSIAVLTGDEHNYSRLYVDNEMPRYPGNWSQSKLSLKRPIWHITNGSAGAPYYGQEELPWSENVKFFSLQYALVIFDVNGTSVTLRVQNPDTLEEIETVQLR
ncbi:MAG: hypothetical protein Q8S18_01120 [Bacteroidales bacterium]|nr:hypothetical protein [Bacteroidales bacterium]